MSIHEDDEALGAFRAEVREWLAAHFPPGLENGGAAPPPSYDRSADSPELIAWRESVCAKGWGTPRWSRAYGGAGLSAAEAGVLEQEMELIGAANPLGRSGALILGPTLLEFGTEEQKLRLLPPIASGEAQWCQGFSEPGAGSDLASLQCRAEVRGDHFLVTGQKVWTSGGQHADMMFCLVRTDRSVKHDGISFVVFSMHAAGVETRPIMRINGESSFCETFLTEVVVPKRDLIGPLNGGWTVAKRLLQHERAGMVGRRDDEESQALPPLGEIAKAYLGVDDLGRLADPDLRSRIVAFEMEERAVRQTARRILDEGAHDGGPMSAPSIMKNANAAVLQARGELLVEILGHNGLGWSGPGFSSDELEAVRVWLGDKAASIYGGSTEIQANIIAKRVLHLPDPKPSR